MCENSTKNIVEAWLDGKTIQKFDLSQEKWIDTPLYNNQNNAFHIWPFEQYRIKPNPSHRYCQAFINEQGYTQISEWIYTEPMPESNLHLTFIDNKLTHAEAI